MADYDIAVIGLGTMGSMALWRASMLPGRSVVGFEQFGPGHAHGSFTGESRLFRTAYHEGAGYVPMLLRARELWLELEKLAVRELFVQAGTLTVGYERDDAVQNVLTSVRRYDLPHEILSSDELVRRFPQHRVAEGTIGVLDRLGGGLRPEVAVLGALEQATANGARVCSHERVVGVERTGGAVRVTTGGGTLTAGKVIVAAGSWAAMLNPALGAKLAVFPLVLTWFAPRHIGQFVPERFPAFIRDEGDVHFYGAPSLDGYSVKVSPARLLGPVPSVADLPGRLDPAFLSEIGRRAQAFFPDLSPEPVRYSLHHDVFTWNKVPVIDLDESGRVVTLTGFSGHGFKFAPVIGEIAVDLATRGGSGLVDERFRIAAHRDWT